MPLGKICKVIKAYQSAYPDPLIIKSGQRLTVGEKESEWAGWAWCARTPTARAAGCRQAYLEIDDGGRRRSRLRDYDATELDGMRPGRN